jgi:viologen exporter family transport system permease protein
VRGYRALARVAAKNALRYRMSFVLSLFGVFFQFLAMLAVWRVLLSQAPVNGFTWDQMRGYLLIAFASGALVGLFGDFRMTFRIRNGMAALDIVQPVRYQEARFAEALGAVWIEVLVVVVVGAILALSGGGLIFPSGPNAGIFLVSLLLLIPLKFLIQYVCGLVVFWTQNYMGVQWARIAVSNLLSGALVPLAYLPHWLAVVASWSPFAGLVSTPGLIMIGQLHGTEALVRVGVQLGWVVLLWAGAKLVWGAAVRSLTVNGG